jgi:predicted O-methyltransferase YrrM
MKFRSIIRNLLPYGFVSWYFKNRQWKILKELGKKNGDLVDFSFKYNRQNYSYDSSVDYILKNFEISEFDIRDGSIPENSMEFACEAIKSVFKNDSIAAIHIGNFIGVSLAYLTNYLKNLNNNSFVISIDPNIPHRKVINPQYVVNSVLSNFDLEKNTLLINSYSGDFNDYIESRTNSNITYCYENGYAPLDALGKLLKLNNNFIHVAFVDGNHEKSSLIYEVETIHKLLTKGGLLVLDDVTDYWYEVKEVYESIEKVGFQKWLYDERVAILVKS